MTHEEQQALFDTILRRANRPGSFNVENGIRLTSLSDGGAEGEVRLTARHSFPAPLNAPFGAFFFSGCNPRPNGLS